MSNTSWTAEEWHKNIRRLVNDYGSFTVEDGSLGFGDGNVTMEGFRITVPILVPGGVSMGPPEGPVAVNVRGHGTTFDAAVRDLDMAVKQRQERK